MKRERKHVPQRNFVKGSSRSKWSLAERELFVEHFKDTMARRDTVIEFLAKKKNLKLMKKLNVIYQNQTENKKYDKLVNSVNSWIRIRYNTL